LQKILSQKKKKNNKYSQNYLESEIHGAYIESSDVINFHFLFTTPDEAKSRY